MKQSQEMTIQNDNPSGTGAVISAKVSTSTIAEIDAIAFSSELTRSSWIRAAVTEKLVRDGHAKRKGKH